MTHVLWRPALSNAPQNDFPSGSLAVASSRSLAGVPCASPASLGAAVHGRDQRPPAAEARASAGGARAAAPVKISLCRGGTEPVLNPPNPRTHAHARTHAGSSESRRVARPRDSRLGQNERLGDLANRRFGDSAIRRFGARPGTTPEPRRTGDTGCTASSSQANMDRDNFNLDSTHQAGQVRNKERSTGEHSKPTSCARRHRGLLPPFCRLGKRKPVSQ